MNRRPNRIILIITALVLVAAGLLPLLASTGVLPVQEPGEAYGDMAASAAAYPWAWSLGLIVGGLLLAALGAWLIRRQLRIRRGGRLDTVVVQRADRGRTTLAAVAAANAAAADLRAKQPINDSGVRMVTFGERPRLVVDLDVPADTDPRRALGAAEDVYERLRHTLGVDALHVDTQLHTVGDQSSRVE